MCAVFIISSVQIFPARNFYSIHKLLAGLPAFSLETRNFICISNSNANAVETLNGEKKKNFQQNKKKNVICRTNDDHAHSIKQIPKKELLRWIMFL